MNPQPKMRPLRTRILYQLRSKIALLSWFTSKMKKRKIPSSISQLKSRLRIRIIVKSIQRVMRVTRVNTVTKSVVILSSQSTKRLLQSRNLFSSSDKTRRHHKHRKRHRQEPLRFPLQSLTWAHCQRIHSSINHSHISMIIQRQWELRIRANLMRRNIASKQLITRARCSTKIPVHLFKATTHQV